MDKNRLIAYKVLMDMEEKQAWSNLALNHHIREGQPDSPALVRELVYGVLENRILLDYILGSFVKTPVGKLKKSDRTLLRLGIYQLKFLDGVPEYAAVNECVALAKKYCRGRDGFVNAVLRSFIRAGKEAALPDPAADLTRYLSVKYSYEPWIIELWLSQYDAGFAEELLAAGNLAPDLVIRINLLKTTRTELLHRLLEGGYQAETSEICERALKVTGTGLLDDELYKEGLFSVQDESSLLAADILSPQPGETVVDVCAAPGGKTLAIAEMMQNQGLVVACDIYEKKLAVIDREAERLGISIVSTRVRDGITADPSMAFAADRVLVDAPCSGLGVIRRKPEIKYKEKPDNMAELPTKQLAILSAAAGYVKTGGALVYSTCTISPYENEGVTGKFLAANPDFRKELERQLFPNVDGTDGFYICKMLRTD